MRRSTKIGALLTAGALALAACSSTSTTTSTPGAVAGSTTAGSAAAGSAPAGSAPAAAGATGQQLVLGNNGDITSWDPAEMKEGSVINYAEAVYDPLMTKAADASIVPNLATKWVYNTDLTQLTLTLRTDVTFTDGQKFDGSVVKANLEHAQKGAGSASEAAKSISTIDVVDPTTVKLTLSTPNPGLLSALATYAGFMVSPKSLTAGTEAATPVGSGPYTLDAAQTTKGTSYMFVKNTKYWNSSAYPFGTVVIKPIEDYSARFNALKTGQIEFMYGTNDMIDGAKASGLTVGTVPGEWQGIILQDRGGTVLKPLGDVRVRQAINYAIDRATIVKTYYNGYAQVSTQTFNPGSEAWADSLNSQYPYDPAKAKSLLAAAGYPNGFELPIGYGSGFIDPLVAILTQYLGDVGIKVKPVVMNGNDTNGLQKMLQNPSYMLSFSTNIPAWTDVLNKVTPTSLWNGLKYEDPKVDALLAEIPKYSGDKQAVLYKQLNTYLVDQAWFAPVATLKNIYLSSPKISVTMQQSQLLPSLRFFKPAA